MNNEFPTESQKLLDYLKKKNKETAPANTIGRGPSPQDWQRWQIEEQQQFEEQAATVVEWNDLSDVERVQAKLSGSELYRRWCRVDRAETRRYWEHAFDMPVIKKYLDLIDNEPTYEQ